jgi:hypothetical protein
MMQGTALSCKAGGAALRGQTFRYWDENLYIIVFYINNFVIWPSREIQDDTYRSVTRYKPEMRELFYVDFALLNPRRK